ncbi:superinfection immunity protein [Mycobacterium sp. 5-140-3-2]|uniref:superinfection immunity protein n=1 Tax=Mycobacterium TaxID=1763 RepID=UPI001914E1DE|nr:MULTISPECIES: superinfection immunity protein [Mycobacterium]WRU80811.1 superinfection immunity protein [Mycobacterium sp. 5-140-3-2]WSE43036.1 superinfection immunity protein [Mycobacterium sp. 5-140-3-1]
MAIAGWVIVAIAAAWAVFLFKGIFFSDSGDISVPQVLVFVALTALTLGFYFLPTIVAAYRSSPNTGSIAVINVFLGWTFIGWVISLAMAVAGNTRTG